MSCEFPGFGVGDDFGGHPMLTAQSAAVSFVEASGLDRIHIVGNSMGGGVAIKFATSHPDKVGHLVTIGGIGINIFSPGPSEGIRLLQEFVDEPTGQRLIDWLYSMVYEPALVTEELIEERWRLAGRRPAGTRHVFPNRGHWAVIEAKEAFESALLALLTR